MHNMRNTVLLARMLMALFVDVDLAKPDIKTTSEEKQERILVEHIIRHTYSGNVLTCETLGTITSSCGS